MTNQVEADQVDQVEANEVEVETDEVETPTAIVKYGNHTFNVYELPESSRLSLFSKGITHYLGNEQASKVTTWAKKLVAAGTPPTDEDIAAKKAEFVAAAVKAILDGTVGVRASSGPRATPIESIMRRIAKEQLIPILIASEMVWPGNKELITFKNGTKLTGNELIDRRLANPEHAKAIRALAEKEIKAKEREAEAKRIAAEKAAASSDDVLSLIG